jgi:uncharacterized protein YraI
MRFRTHRLGTTRALAGALIVASLLLSACNLISQRENQQNLDRTATAQASNRPTIAIISPPNGAEFTVGSPVLINVTASDSIGVTRVTLSVAGQVIDSQQSEAPNGSPTLNALLDFTPQQVGTITLSAVAARGSVTSDPAIIQINVRENPAAVTATLPPQPIPSINPNDPTCRALVKVGLNVRTGPGTVYPVITTLAAGSVVPIIGRTAANDWWQVRINMTTIGWINAPFTDVYGNCTLVPIVQPPPTPTGSAPTATFTPPPPTNTLTLTPQPPTATATPGPADLVLSSIVGPNSVTLGPGNAPVSVTFSITVTNTGQSAAGQFTTTLGIVSVGTPQSVGVVANLLPGESIVLSGTLTFTSAGTFTVIAQADSLNQITEISEVNNTGTVIVNVGAAP